MDLIGIIARPQKAYEKKLIAQKWGFTLNSQSSYLFAWANISRCQLRYDSYGNKEYANQYPHFFW